MENNVNLKKIRDKFNLSNLEAAGILGVQVSTFNTYASEDTPRTRALAVQFESICNAMLQELIDAGYHVAPATMKLYVLETRAASWEIVRERWAKIMRPAPAAV